MSSSSVTVNAQSRSVTGIYTGSTAGSTARSSLTVAHVLLKRMEWKPQASYDFAKYKITACTAAYSEDSNSVSTFRAAVVFGVVVFL